MRTEHPKANIQSLMETINALEAIRDSLSPPPGSIFEEMLNDALNGRIRLEATDTQERMLIQHDAKQQVQHAISILQRLL
jgi:hypothetical protein